MNDKLKNIWNAFPSVSEEKLNKSIQLFGKWCSPFVMADPNRKYPMAIDHFESLTLKSKDKLPFFRNLKMKHVINVYPSIDSMQSMDLKNVHYFKVLHKRYGKVVFKEPVDVRGLALDEVFMFSNKELDIHSEGTPLSGKKVEIHIFNTFPLSITPKGIDDYKIDLQRHSDSIGAKFVAYEKGTYIFEVNLS
jgi:hypothetical protein